MAERGLLFEREVEAATLFGVVIDMGRVEPDCEVDVVTDEGCARLGLMADEVLEARFGRADRGVKAMTIADWVVANGEGSEIHPGPENKAEFSRVVIGRW